MKGKKLEDFTKEEIIKAINHSYLNSSVKNAILDYCEQARLESINKKIEKAQAEWKIANDEVETFKKKYIYGKKLTEVPMNLIQKGAELERKESNAWNEYIEICDQLDKMYER